MLQDAIAGWRSKGLTTCPLSKARELADLAAAEPARVQSLIEAAEDAIREAAAAKRPFNPLGFVLWGLGESQKNPGVLYSPTLQIDAKWRDAEAEVVRLYRVQASIDARARTPRGDEGGHAARKDAVS
jgi:hypothetical protein